MYKRSLLSLFVSSLLFSVSEAAPPAWVSDNTENAEGIVTPEPAPTITANLSKVVISGALKEELAIAESAASIAHFDTKEIDRLNASSLADLLVYEPGVTVDQSKSGGLNDIRIRGMGSDRVLISVDGAPLPTTLKFGTYLDTNRNYFDLDAMKSVDIIKGPMSTLYGGSALAGGVFMQTKDPSDFIKAGQRFGGETKVGYRTASRETLLSGTIAGQFTDKFSAFARFTYMNPHERANYGGKASSESLLGPNRTHSDAIKTDSYNILTKAVFEANEDHRFSLSYENFRETADLTPLSKFGDVMTMLDPKSGMQTEIHTLSLYQKDKNKRQQVTFRHDFDHENTLFDRGFWNLYYQNNHAEQDIYEQRKTEVKHSASGQVIMSTPSNRNRYSTFKSHSYGIGAEFTKAFAQNDALFHNFTYGLNFRENRVSTLRDGYTLHATTGANIERETFPTKSFPDSKIREYGAFFQDRMSLFDGQFEVIAGLRYDHYKLRTKTGTLFESANKAVTPEGVSKGNISKRLALLWHPTEENTLFVNYSEGFRAPTFSAVNVGFGNPTGPMPYESLLNPQLKPETSKSIELGWNYLDNTKSFAVTGFYTKYDQFIEELHLVKRTELPYKDPNGDPVYMHTYQAVNLDKSHIYGLEVKAQMDLFTIQDGSGTIGFNASLAYAKGRENGTKNPINSVEPLTAVIGIDYQYLDQLYLSARIKAVRGKKNNDIYFKEDPQKFGSLQSTPGYATLDLIAEYKPQRDITINAGLYNVLDKQYWTWGRNMMEATPNEHYRRSNPGFNAALSVKYEF